MPSPVLVGGTGRLGRLVVRRLRDAGRRASHRRRVVLPVRIPGTRAVRDGGLLPPPGHTVGRRTWEQFLTTSLGADQPSSP
jgi:hypothetical protein